MDISDVSDVTNHEQVVRALLEANANVEAVNNEGWTALMYACQNGHSEVGSRFVDPTHHTYAHIFSFIFMSVTSVTPPHHEQVARNLLEPANINVC